MTASPALCMLCVALVFVGLPLDAWLLALPAAVKHRNRVSAPTYRHEL